ncbi:MAG: helix-turn-helix transcriptional regulator [Clostridia bacterium]|nr:helix-turn-helix transcriptional regulator [Clostridia bacterium]
MKISKELLKGTSATLVLSVLEQQDLYGYVIIRELEQRSETVFSMNEGTLYPILHALEAERYLESYWEEYDGRKRKYYHITKKGLRALAEKKEEWTVYTNAVQKVLNYQSV